MLRDLLLRPRGAIVVVGGGKQGVSAARTLRARGGDVAIVDDGDASPIRDRLARAGLDDVAVTGGGVAHDACERAALVVLSAGVPRAHPAIARALAASVPVVGEVDVACAALDRCRILAITGSNGKSTTTTIAGAMVRAHDATAFVGGNLGTPLCDALTGDRVPAYAVVELSSYQLETLTLASFQGAVVTNLSPDHLDRYPSVDAYYEAKGRVFTLLVDGGGSSINARDRASTELFHARARGRALDFAVADGAVGVSLRGRTALVVGDGGLTTEIALASPFLVGDHNLENAMAALAGVSLLGVPANAWQAGIDAYRGIAHRLERVGERDGVTFVNDSKATNVDAAVKAVASYARGVRLIAGGVGKGASYAPLVDAARGRVAALYTIGQDAPAIRAAFAGACAIFEEGTLARAFARALADAAPGDVVLLAPACASFDQFKNYEDRGDQFRQMSKRWIEEGIRP